MKSELLEFCRLCPRNCGIDRTAKQIGYCRTTSDILVARAALHYWEEPCISGTAGSGAVFFGGCNLGCVFCQNKDIVTGHVGQTLSITELADTFVDLQSQGAHNINLVTPTHYVPMIADAIDIAKSNGLNIPIVYNTGSYEKVETIKLLKEKVDIFLPDFKYFDSSLAERFSNAHDYPKTAKECIHEMVSTVGKCEFDSENENALIKRGVIVRHLVLPGHTKDSMKIIEYLYKTYGDSIYISIMNQYTPMLCKPQPDYPELTRKVTAYEYNKVVDYALSLGITNAFIQEGNTQSESFIPPFSSDKNVL